MISVGGVCLISSLSTFQSAATMAGLFKSRLLFLELNLAFISNDDAALIPLQSLVLAASPVLHLHAMQMFFTTYGDNALATCCHRTCHPLTDLEV